MASKLPIPVLVAMANFKGTLSNHDATKIVAKAAKKSGFHVIAEIPIGDGGQGTLTCLKGALGGAVHTVPTRGPLGDPTTAKVLCLPDSKKPTSIFIESSEACGAHLLGSKPKDIMRASSLGVGELIKACLEKWPSISRISVGLGDTAISDMGMGMLAALGYEFRDYSGNILWGNAEGLRNIRSIAPPKNDLTKNVSFTILCDVMNPLLGPEGSARVFAPQKGATPAQISLIESGMENFSELISKLTGHRLNREPMTGSAGGLSAAFKAFFHSELVQGARFLLDWTEFSKSLKEASLVITGEGRTDRQTLGGKAPFEVLLRGQQLGKKVLFVSGSVGEGYESLQKNPALLGIAACEKAPKNEAEAKKLLTQATTEALSHFQSADEFNELALG